VARDDKGGFLAGLVVGGLVGAALALLYAPREGRVAGGSLLQRGSALLGGDAEALLEEGRRALRARFTSAADAAQQAAAETEARLQEEYRSATQGSQSAPL
jgi:gas vesicle protein